MPFTAKDVEDISELAIFHGGSTGVLGTVAMVVPLLRLLRARGVISDADLNTYAAEVDDLIQAAPETVHKPCEPIGMALRMLLLKPQ